jgi:hypothetical protein
MTSVLEKEIANALPVKLVGVHKSNVERIEAADYGVWSTYTLTGTENALQILPRDLFRRRAVIQVNTTVTGRSSSGSVTSPGAGATIASLILVLPGAYQIKWTVQLTGTVGAADQDNFQLNAGSLTFPSLNAGAVGVYPQTDADVVLSASVTTVTITAIAAGTVGAVYTAQITLIPITPAPGFCFIGSRPQVQNKTGGRLRAGNQFTVEDVQDYYVTGDGVTPLEIVVLNERYDPTGQNMEQSEQDTSGGIENEEAIYAGN